jgi:hypothetical protein
MAGERSGCETERCDGLDNDCDDEVDEDSVCPDACSAQQFDGHAYLLCVSSTDTIGADDASARCLGLGVEFGLEHDMGLAWIESSDENTFLMDWIMGTAPTDGVVWMGASDQSMEYTWVWGRKAGAEQFFTGSSDGGGSPYMDRFADFGSGQPGSSRGLDEDCGAFDGRVDWHWSDRECDEAMVGFVCEERSTP